MRPISQEVPSTPRTRTSSLSLARRNEGGEPSREQKESLCRREREKMMVVTEANRSQETTTALDDDALWEAFQSRALPEAAWTHVEHLRVAWMHLARYSVDEAHLR